MIAREERGEYTASPKFGKEDKVKTCFLEPIINAILY
jgi:hypothetical protein